MGLQLLACTLCILQPTRTSVCPVLCSPTQLTLLSLTRA